METIGEKAEGKSLTRSVTKKSTQKRRITNCESCMNYEYDEEYEYYVCSKNLDEDEMYRFVRGEFRDCPYYQFGDEYQIVMEMTREELLAECSERIELKTDDTGKACTVLENMGIHQYKVVDADTIQIFERLNDGGSITMTLAENGVKTVGITIKNEALEDYYLNLTGGALNV